MGSRFFQPLVCKRVWPLGVPVFPLTTSSLPGLWAEVFWVAPVWSAVICNAPSSDCGSRSRDNLFWAPDYFGSCPKGSYQPRMPSSPRDFGVGSLLWKKYKTDWVFSYIGPWLGTTWSLFYKRGHAVGSLGSLGQGSVGICSCPSLLLHWREEALTLIQGLPEKQVFIFSSAVRTFFPELNSKSLGGLGRTCSLVIGWKFLIAEEKQRLWS